MHEISTIENDMILPGAFLMDNSPVHPSSENLPALLPSGNVERNELHLLDRNYSTGTLLKALAHKARRKFFGPPRLILPAYRYGVLVFDREDLDGGGSAFGQDYIRALREI